MNLGVVLGLMGLPLLSALALLAARREGARIAVVAVSAICLTAGPLALAFLHLPDRDILLGFHWEYANYAILTLELAVGVYIALRSIRSRRPMAAILALGQVAIMSVFELTTGHRIVPEHAFVVDKLSIIMALIIGIVGSLICVYALGYMREEQSHAPAGSPDRRPRFFATLYLFMSAMFGIVFSNNTVWLYFFWEITTLCSFLLIGYRRDEQSERSAFRALVLNLLGGFGMAVGIVLFAGETGSVELDRLVALGPSIALVPATLLTVAAVSKAAQLPFTPWLVGAMVAPTPVSALLHSSTMVKAGVYLVLRLAPLLAGTTPGHFVALVGGLTFLLASLIAIAQSDAKKVLAYSTVANLGLIVLCGGVGTHEALWAGVLLLVFHAVAKALLFLCVGTVEHRIGSRDVEAMSGLIVRLPGISILMQIGMAGMFLAPFGMLISKYAVLKALIDYSPILTVFLVFGSGATVLFWVKWMGKLLVVTGEGQNLERGTTRAEWLPLRSLAVLTVALCGCFPLVSSYFIEPYVRDIYGISASMERGNVIIMIIMLALVALFPLTFFFYNRKVKVMEAYLGGANADSSVLFMGSMGRIREAGMRNYYLDAYFGEGKLLVAGMVLCGLLLCAMVAGAFLW